MGARRLAIAVLGLVLMLLVPARATADGLPALGIDVGRVGLTDGDGSRYVTIGAGERTLLARIDMRGGEIDRSRLLRGRFTIPAVAYDGSAGGLSADGRTLVLIRPRITRLQLRRDLARRAHWAPDRPRLGSGRTAPARLLARGQPMAVRLHRRARPGQRRRRHLAGLRARGHRPGGAA